MGHFQLPRSYNIIFQVCTRTFLELVSDGSVKVATVGNCCINQVCFFDGFVKYNYVWSIVIIVIIIIILYW